METLAAALVENPHRKLSVYRNGQLLGVFGIDQFLARVEQGELGADDEVAVDGVAGRTPVSEAHPAAVVAAARPRPRGLARLLPRPGARRQSAAWGAIVPAAGMGCLGAGGIGGGGIIALLVVGLYLWGTIDMNRSGALEQRTADLRNTIVRFVDAHPDFQATSGEALLGAIPLDDADREFIEDHRLVVHPIDARSPDDALVIVRPQKHGQRMYYRGGHGDYILRLPSPDGRLELVNEPQQPLHSGRLIRLSDAAGTVRLAHRTPAFAVSAKWRPDGRMIALNETSQGHVRLSIVVIGSGGDAQAVPGGALLEPAAILPDDVRDAPLRWLSDNVAFAQWLPSGAMRVERFANVTVLDAGDRPQEYVTARQQVDVSISADGQLQIVAQKPVKHHRSAAQAEPLQPPMPPPPLDALELG